MKGDDIAGRLLGFAVSVLGVVGDLAIHPFVFVFVFVLVFALDRIWQKHSRTHEARVWVVEATVPRLREHEH